MTGRRGLAAAALALAARSAAAAPGLPAVTLIDQDGAPRALAGLGRGRPLVLSFFFSGCTTLCPPQAMALQALQEELAGRAPAVAPLLLSVSLDPLGDTPEAMRRLAARFGLSLGLQRGWLLLGGEPAQLARVWAAFEAPDGRPTDHAALLWLGAAEDRAWRRVGALTPTATLADLLLRSPP